MIVEVGGADEDDDVRVVVLGHNGAHFAAGYDLKENWREKYKGAVGVLATRNTLQSCVDFEHGPWDCNPCRRASRRVKKAFLERVSAPGSDRVLKSSVGQCGDYSRFTHMRRYIPISSTLSS